MSLYLVIFAVALCGTLVATPMALRTALRLDIVDRPGGRKAHHAPIPYLGGLAIYAGFVLFVLGDLVRPWLDPALQPGSGTPPQQALAILAGATLMLVLGLVDDRFALRPLLKLGGQVLAALLLYLSGIHFHFNHYPFSYLDFPVSMVWVLGMINAFNLLDNMDGLSVGTAAIACSYFFVLAEMETPKQYIVASMAIALCGASLGFLYYNFNPARIFMGDAGSLFLGLMLAVIGLKINMHGFSNLHAVNFFVPVVVLGIPIFDTTLVTVSRLRRRVPVSRGGRDHTSHRLVLLGLTVREAVMAVYLAACALGLAGIMLTIASPRSGAVLIGLLIAAGIAAGVKMEQVYNRQTPIHPAPPPAPVPPAERPEPLAAGSPRRDGVESFGDDADVTPPRVHAMQRPPHLDGPER